MRFSVLLPAFLASTLVSADPDIEGILGDLANDEIHVYKRDAAISARDIELAERDNVDLEQMFRHSIIKRDDGDHVTIWVAREYVENEAAAPEPDLEKRQMLRIGSQSLWGGDERGEKCRGDTYVGDTGPNAPFTGGANAISRWASDCSGNWVFLNNPVSRNLVVAGSDRGFNMRFTAKPRGRGGGADDLYYFGCRDVGRITRTARNRFQRRLGGMRVRARGGTSCVATGRACYKSQCQGIRGDMHFDWWVDNWDRPVHK